MGYYLHAFCTSTQVPTLRTVMQFTEAQGYPLMIPQYFGEVDLDTSTWVQAEFTCARDDSHFVAETACDDGTPDNLLRAEIAEFVEMIEEVRSRKYKQHVLDHLHTTKYIISTQILTAESGHWEVEAANIFLHYFLQHCGGMLQADGEGFYQVQLDEKGMCQKERLILRME